MKFKEILNNYNTNLSIVKESTDRKRRIQTTLFGILVSLILCFSPFVFLCNLFVFSDFVLLIALGIVLIIIVFLVLTDIIGFKVLKNYYSQLREINYRLNVYVNLGIYSLICLVCYAVFTIIVGCLSCL